MLKPKPPQSSFYGSYLYDRIVPQDHLLRKINAVVDFSFVNDLVRDRYTPNFGRPAEDPEYMLRLCLLQYIYGDSDREVIENARMHNGYKYFLGMAVDEEPPDASTLSCFRAMRLGEEKFRQVFENIVGQCIEKGLVTGRRQIIDSTHIEADVTRNSLAGVIRMCRRNVLRDVSGQNKEAAERLGREPSISKQDRFTKAEEGLDEEVAEARDLLSGVIGEIEKGSLKVTPELARSLEILEKAVSDREEGATDRLVSPVDPDARAGRKTGKSWAGYKGHVIVEEDSEIITAVETTPANKDDGSQLKTLLKQQKGNHSVSPGEMSADKAYGSGANLEILEASNITGFVSLAEKPNSRGAGLFGVKDFRYDGKNDTLTCPAGHAACRRENDLVMTEKLRRQGIRFEFDHHLCTACDMKDRCFRSASQRHGRAVFVSRYEPLYQQMKDRMESEEGKAAYRERYRIEHKVADLARWCGMRRCRYRGLVKARIHTLLSATVSNIKRMARLLWPSEGRPPLMIGMSC